MDQLLSLLDTLETPIGIHALVFIVNLIVLFFADRILQPFNKGKEITVQARALRFGSIVFLILHVADIFVGRLFPLYENFFIRCGYTIATFFSCLLIFNIVSYFSRQKFGVSKKIDGDEIYLDTYNSRLMDLISTIIVVLIAIYCLIMIWEMDGLLQTTGFLGITFAFLALTNAIWAPDIYYGLVILNSNMLEDGDVIKFQGHPDEHVISRVTFIYTILLDVRNNHRILIRNSQLINNRVDNLSKRASADGLRHVLKFNIGYAKGALQGDQNPFETLHGQVEDMFEEAFEIISANNDIKINRKLPFELALLDSGDYALQYALYYYLEPLPSTKVTKTIRSYLARTPAEIQRVINVLAVKYNLALATPVLIDMGNSEKQPPLIEQSPVQLPNNLPNDTNDKANS